MGDSRKTSAVDNRRRVFLLGGSALPVLAMMGSGAHLQIAQAQQQQQPGTAPSGRRPIR